MDQVKAASKADLPEVIRLVNAVFIGDTPNSTLMEDKFPIFLSEQNLDHIQIICDQGRPVSHVGYYQTRILIQGCPVEVGSIGSVCTDPAYRGQGLASRILDVVEEKARKEGIQVLLISGDRSLYLRRQCTQVGGFVDFTLEHRLPVEPAIAAELQIVDFDWADFPELLAIYNQEAVRFYRSAEEFEALLKGGLQPFFYATPRLCAVKSGGRIAAYFILNQSDNHPTGEIIEYAGERRLLRAALQAIREQARLESLSVRVPFKDPLAAYLHFEDPITGKPALQLGTVKIINFASLMKSLRPYFLQYMPSRVINAVEWAEKDGRFFLLTGGECVEVGGLDVLNRLVFGAVEGRAIPENLSDFLANHAAAKEKIENAFPIPFPWAGNINFI